MSRFIFASLILLTSPLAHGGQESFGGGLCQHADVLCTSPEGESKEGAVTVCLFGHKRAQAIVSVEHDGGSTSHHFEVVQAPVDRHLLGAPERFSGDGMELSIGVTTAPTPIGQHSILSIEDLGISDKVIYCRFQR